MVRRFQDTPLLALVKSLHCFKMADEDMELELLRMAALRSMQSKTQSRTTDCATNVTATNQTGIALMVNREKPSIANRVTTISNISKTYDRPMKNYSNRNNYQNPIRLGSGPFRASSDVRPHREGYNRSVNRMGSPNKNGYKSGPTMDGDSRRPVVHNRNTRNINQSNQQKDWESFEFNQASRSNLIVLTSENKPVEESAPKTSLHSNRPYQQQVRAPCPIPSTAPQQKSERDEERLPSRFRRIEKDSDSEEDDEDDENDNDDYNDDEHRYEQYDDTEKSGESSQQREQNAIESLESDASNKMNYGNDSGSETGDTLTTCEPTSYSSSIIKSAADASKGNTETMALQSQSIEFESQNEASTTNSNCSGREKDCEPKQLKDEIEQTDNLFVKDYLGECSSLESHSDRHQNSELSASQSTAQIAKKIETVSGIQRIDRLQRNYEHRRSDDRSRPNARNHLGKDSRKHDHHHHQHHTNRKDYNVHSRLEHSDESHLNQQKRSAHSKHHSHSKRRRRSRSPDHDNCYKSDSSSDTSSRASGRKLRSLIVQT